MNRNQAISEYKSLLRYQQSLPEDRQWTVGEDLRAAKNRIYVEIEHDRALTGRDV